MAVSEASVTFDESTLAEVQRLLRESSLDGWLLYDFRGTNPIATGVLGLPTMTRRFFALIPSEGRPVALTHRIEQQPWRGWLGENRPYLSWQSLEGELQRLLKGRGTLAVERSEGDAVPYVDRIPGGVQELIDRSGVRTVSSGDLVSAFYARWSAEGEASHRRAGRLLRETAFGAFDRIGEALRHRGAPTEWELRQWVVGELVAGGLSVGADAIVAVGPNAANPHYAPGAHAHSMIERGSVILIDLWGKERTDAIYADQTWMAFAGEHPSERVEAVWRAVRDARDAAVQRVRGGASVDGGLRGCDVDDAARDVIRRHGFGDSFIHRTGHSIDRELHGSGPNLDNLETRDTRRLIPGVGFSVEPGVYLPGEIGMRSEINVLMSADGPIVTTPDPQDVIHRITVN